MPSADTDATYTVTLTAALELRTQVERLVEHLQYLTDLSGYTPADRLEELEPIRGDIAAAQIALSLSIGAYARALAAEAGQ